MKEVRQMNGFLNMWRRVSSALGSPGKSKKSKKREGPLDGEISRSRQGSDGKFTRLWGWVLPAAAGLMAGWFGTTCLEVLLDGANGRNRPIAAEASLVSSVPEEDPGSMTAFLRTNPFKISPVPVPEADEGGAEESEEAPEPVTGSLEAALLKGTSPGYMAWLEDQGKLRLVMLGGSFDLYSLEEVTYLDATFVKDGQRVVKEIAYGRTGAVASMPAPPVLPASAVPTGQVAPPDPGRGVKGAISRELMVQLLENPFDELKNVRIRPLQEGQGLRVEWINNRSILSQFGVRQGDVVHSVNGIVFRNATDIMNSLNSLMASDQFIVDVTRGGAPTSLEYEVR